MAPADFPRDPRAASQAAALLSPFSPVFDLELDAKRVGSQAAMERCWSEQAFAQDGGGGQHPAAGAAARPSLMQQILQLCRCTSPMATQLLQHLQRLRAAFGADGPPRHPAAARSSSPPGVPLVPESSVDIEAMACELLASGFLVQVRDGAQQQERTKNARSCLQNLRHRYLVCLGRSGSEAAEPEYLPEPLVVEPRFREQFAIAHPTSEYEALLQAVPPCFVGSVGNLESVVKLLCEQMVIAFKVQGLPVPPWRTRQALMSKWSPTQLADLAAKIANVRRLSVDMGAGSTAAAAAGGAHAHGRLRNGDRPAAAHAPHAAVGSAPPLAGNAADQASTAAAAAAAGLAPPQPLTAQQLMAIMPPEMQRQLQPQLLQPAAHAHVHAPACAGPAAAQQAPLAGGPVARAAPGAPVVHPAPLWPGAGCGPGAAAGGGGPAVVAALPVCAVAPGAAGVAAHAAGVPGVPPRGLSPAAADMLALLEAAEGLGVGGSPTGTLKFTRKASAEWKNQRSSGRKMKGLLAAALKKPSGGSSRTNLAGDGLAAAAAAAAAQLACGVGAAAGTGGPVVHAEGAPMSGGSGGEPLIRRTHYRPTGDEPWRRITTVRWGAYQQQAATAAAAASHQQQSQQHQHQHQQRPF